MNSYRIKVLFSVLFCILFLSVTKAQKNATLIEVQKGWSQNSINTVVFRKNSLTSFDSLQFIAFYDSLGRVVLGKRNINSENWELKTTDFSGNVKDAHNAISIIVDGQGFLHISWDHHNNPLNYARSAEPFSYDFNEKISMIGINEKSVSYPEFYNLPDGYLLFLYRDGESGSGNLIINRYDVENQSWKRIQTNLIDGENERNAYWQAYVDEKGSLYLSWVWRETWDVATNHDLCYAVSHDSGVSWVNSIGKTYDLPITQKSAEIAWSIPQKSELINQTSMCADDNGNPYIATYWKDNITQVPQYQIIYHENGSWEKSVASNRTASFSLSGGGTKSIPISRPQLLMNHRTCYLIFRDQERGNKASISICKNLSKGKWKTVDIIDFSVGSWEPSFDTPLWQKSKKLHLFVQKTGQGDGETLEDFPSQMVNVLEVK